MDADIVKAVRDWCKTKFQEKGDYITAETDPTVPEWAKEPEKPAYSKSEVGLENVPNVTTNDQTPTFTEAAERENIVSGEKLTAIFGKIAKYFSDLKMVAFSGKYTDLKDAPTMAGVQASTLKELVEKIMFSPNLRSTSGNIKITEEIISGIKIDWYQFSATWQNQYNQGAYDIGLILVLSNSSFTNKWYRVSINGKNGSYTVEKVEYVEFGPDGAVAGKVNLTNNLLANVAGVSALDAAQGSVIQREIDSINNNLSELSSSLTNLIINKVISFDGKTIAANNNAQFEKDVTLDGYTPIIVTPRSTGLIEGSFYSVYLSGNKAIAGIHNFLASSAIAAPSVNVLYRKV